VSRASSSGSGAVGTAWNTSACGDTQPVAEALASHRQWCASQCRVERVVPVLQVEELLAKAGQGGSGGGGRGLGWGHPVIVVYRTAPPTPGGVGGAVVG